MQRGLLDLIERGRRQGALRSDLPADLLPQAIVGTLRTTLRFARSLHTDPERVGADVAELLLNGITHRHG
jgi:hypothetical protein